MGAGAAVGRVGVGTGSAAAASVGDDDAMGESGCGGGLHFRMGLLLCGGAVMATAARGDDGVLTATGEGGIEEARLILRRDWGETTARDRNRSIGGRTLVAGWARLGSKPRSVCSRLFDEYSPFLYYSNRRVFLYGKQSPQNKAQVAVWCRFSKTVPLSPKKNCKKTLYFAIH
jgi:hypothetical protein